MQETRNHRKKRSSFVNNSNDQLNHTNSMEILVFNEIHSKWAMLSYYQDGIRVVLDAKAYPDNIDRLPSSSRIMADMVSEMVYKTKFYRQDKFLLLLCCERLGRDSNFRAELYKNGIVYMTKIPNYITMYLEDPRFSNSNSERENRPKSAQDIARYFDFYNDYEKYSMFINGRQCSYRCNAKRIYTTIEYDDDILREWIFLKKEKNDSTDFALSNSSITTALETLYLLHCLFDEVILDLNRNIPEYAFKCFQAKHINIIPMLLNIWKSTNERKLFQIDNSILS